MVTVLFLGSTQLLALGVLGLYIHAIYLEVKGRPNYIVESVYGFEDDSAGKELNSQESPHKSEKT